MKRALVSLVLAGVGAWIFHIASLSGAAFTVFGPEPFVRKGGAPATESREFSGQDSRGPCLLRLHNGGVAGQFGLVSSAVVRLNGQRVAGPSDFNQNVALIERPVTVRKTNTLTVELRSAPGSGFTLAVVCERANRPPVASAGPDQTARVGTPVTLDGSASSDPDGNPLSYEWAFDSVPAGSTVTLSDPSAVRPIFTPDRPGQYVVGLVVNDGELKSDRDVVTVSTVNSAPVAHAGADQTVRVGETVTLDGTGSTDVDGDALRYRWSLATVPQGSGATLDDPTSVRPRFVVDRPGIYAAELIVHDGTVDSTPDIVVITTRNSAPVANAGPDQSVVVGRPVQLDGSGSGDANGDLLSFEWSLIATPAGSHALLANPATARPSFVPDLPGDYVAQLVVRDAAASSGPDTVTITTTNSAPTANAGPDQVNVPVGTDARLDGSGSSDPDGQALSYSWSLLTKPLTSLAALRDASASQPSFTADVPGEYVAQLIVSDGFLSSVPDTVSIRTATLERIEITPAPAVTIALGDSFQFSARGTFSDAAVQDPLSGVQWTSSDPSVASISPIGLVVGGANGLAQIAASRDGIVSPTTTVTVVPPAGNLPPVVDAGADVRTALLAATTLSGTATDDGLPAGVVTLNWQKISGPGDVIFVNATSSQAQATFHRLGTYVLRLTANDTVLQANDDVTIHVVCPAGPYPQGQLAMCDDFARPDGAVGNGWSTWHGEIFNSSSIAVAGNRLSTRGFSNRAGGVVRTLPVAFPVMFSFEQQAAFDARNNACTVGQPYNEIAWAISFNGAGVPPNTPFRSDTRQQVFFTQYAGSRSVIRWHWNGSAMIETIVPNLPEPISTQRDFQPQSVARIEGVVDADLSAIVTVFYNDGLAPVSSTFQFPPAAGAPIAAPGAILSFGNNTCNPGITYYDNLDVRAETAPSLVSVEPALSAPGRTETVLITGLNTHFVDGTTQARLGPGISVGGAPAGEFGPVTVLSPVTATAQLSISTSTELGGRQVLVRTGSELATFGTSIQILPNFNSTGQLAHVVHLGDNLNDIRFLPPNPSGTNYRATFRLPSAPAQGSVPILLIDQYQADNSNPADRSFAAINGTRLGALSLNSLIVQDLRGATSIPVVTDAFSLRGMDLVSGDVEVLVQAGDVHIGPPDTFDDLDITNIRVRRRK